LTFKRVLVGIDGSRAGWKAKDYAFEIAKGLDVPVVGIHVMDSRLMDESFLEDLAGVLGFTYYLGISEKVKDFLEEQANTLIEEFLAEGRQRGLKVSSFQTVGVPHEELLSQADPEDLMVMGKRGRRPLKGFLLSSNAEMVSRRSRCPVLLVPEEERAIKKICLAYDGREVSKKAVPIAKLMAGVFNAELMALHAGDEEIEKPEGIDMTSVRGIPEEVIVSYCKEKGVDMLIMGAYSKGRLRELFLGSVTSFVLHHLDIPILLVK